MCDDAAKGFEAAKESGKEFVDDRTITRDHLPLCF